MVRNFLTGRPSRTHTDQINDIAPEHRGLRGVPPVGDTWVHLGECLSCGHVGCRDSSVSRQERNIITFCARSRVTAR
jgi:hypothetical protein